MRIDDLVLGLKQAAQLLLEGHLSEALWVPRGFAHGAVAVADGTDFIYAVDNSYDPSTEVGFRWQSIAEQLVPLCNLHSLDERDMFANERDSNRPLLAEYLAERGIGQ